MKSQFFFFFTVFCVSLFRKMRAWSRCFGRLRDSERGLPSLVTKVGTMHSHFTQCMNHYCDELIILGWWTLNIAEKISQRCEALLLDSGHCSFASCLWPASKILCKCLEMHFIKLLGQPLRSIYYVGLLAFNCNRPIRPINININFKLKWK